MTAVPPKLRKATVLLVIIGGFVTITFDLFAFLLQIGKDAISAGNVVVGLVFIGLYYTRSVVDSSIRLWTDDLKNKQREQRRIIIEERVSNVLTKVRNRIYLSDNQTMPANRILTSVKRYIEGVWEFKFSLPSEIINLISTIVMLVGFIFVTTVEIQNIALFISVILIISIATIYFACVRGKFRDRYRKNRKELYEKEHIAMNDILNLEPQDEHHSQYMIANARHAMKEAFDYDKKDWHDLNLLVFVENLINSLSTIFIMGIKMYEVGIPNVTLETVLSVIALQTIYSNIMSKVHGVVHRIEMAQENIKSIDSYKEDMEKIMEIYEKEEGIQYSSADCFVVPMFEVEYKMGEKNYKLINPKEFKLHSGECVLLTGPTGCGKSTFMKMLTGKIKMGEVLKMRFMSIMQSSSTRLGSQDVLSEVVFGEDYDEEKLITILKGLHLYDEIMLKSSDVIEYLSKTKTENYSTGQNQRLLIARMLYNLSSNVQIVAFDEATNALNDAIAEQVLSFIKEACKDKLLVIASHQVDICEKFATKHFEFVADEERYVLKQK
ncbi:MAG: ABC transporter ATP-binding protein [Clostridia bacterium]|nr:ABC transporter ATP-binding protein [Clostridia bacterium]